MNLKKIIFSIATCIYVFGCANFALASQTDQIRTIVQNYKEQNYLACLQSTEKLIKEDPSNIYAYYYQALAYTQLGKKEEAKLAYEKTIALNTNATIVKYAQKGKSCLNSSAECKEIAENNDNIEEFLNSPKFFSNPVQSEVNKKVLNRIRTNINNDINGSKKKSEQPTNEEIAEAVKTLARAGFNPMQNMNNMMYTNPEMMQMNMLLSNDNYNNNNNMIPYLLMMQNQQNGTQNNMSPELIQTMMMSQMQMY